MVRVVLLQFAVIALACAAGCGAEPPAAARTTEATPKPDPPSTFDVANSGTITGGVTWVGPIPEVAPALHTVPRPNGTGYDNRHVPLANAPHIDRVTRGVGGAVVYLREINPTQSKSWDLPPVEVAFNGSQIQVKQGDRVGRTGFVKRGAAVTMQSREPVFHSLRGRGAAFFALAFPDPDMPVTRTFDTCGRVELNGHWHDLEPGTVIWIEPGTRHRVVSEAGLRTIVFALPAFRVGDEWFD